VIMAGGFQILFGVLRLGRYVTMMPYTVVSGFMTGIGLILVILQLGPFLGHATPSGGVIGTLQSLPELVSTIRLPELALALFTFVLIVVFPTRLRRVLPPQLVALVLATLASIVLLGQDDIRRIGEIPTGLPDLHLPVFTAEHWRLMVMDALVLAVLGSIDALLTSVVAENLTRKEYSSDKELVGQGVGNMASGLFGGIPGAGATMGTVVNIQTGGRSAFSGLTRAILLLIVVLWAAPLTANIPLAVLAGIAMKVGLDIVDWSFLKRAHRVSAKAAIIMYGVILLTVFVDLVTAVAIGVFVANVLTIDRMLKVQTDAIRAIRVPGRNDSFNRDEQMLMRQARGRVLVFSLRGPLIFGMAKAISRKNAVLEEHEILVLDFTDVPALGVSSSLALESMVIEDLDKGKPVFIVGATGDVRGRLSKLGVLTRLPVDHVVDTRQEALEKANTLLGEDSPSTPDGGAPQVA
jgi:sulfate permease, SulP family